MGRVPGLRLGRLLHDLLLEYAPVGSGSSRTGGILLDARYSLFNVSSPPEADGMHRRRQFEGDLLVLESLRGQQNDLRPEHQLGRGGPSTRQLLKGGTVGVSELNRRCDA